MIINTDRYTCAICGKRNVKLWRPYGYSYPLVCAECAEARQTPKRYEEIEWKKDEGNIYTGAFTGQTLPLPKWKVDENGKVPTYDGPGPKDKPESKTEQLIIDLSKFSGSFDTGNTTMIPAYPDENGQYWNYQNVPQEIAKWWRALPTRKAPEKPVTTEMYGVWTRDDEMSGSFKTYCATKELALRELAKLRDWCWPTPPEPDENHIVKLELVIK